MLTRLAFVGLTCSGSLGYFFASVHAQDRSSSTWALDIDWRIGGRSDAAYEVFGGFPLNLTIGPHGEVLVADPQLGHIHMFDSSGRFVRAIGSRGEGPGEFDVPLAMGWDANSHLWVSDARGYYHVFDSTGVPVESHSHGFVTPARITGQGAFDAEGNFLDETELRPQGSSRITVALIRVAPDGNVIDTLPPMVGPRFDLRDRPLMAFPGAPIRGFGRNAPESVLALARYVPQLIFTVAPDGTLWLAYSNRYQLIQRTLVGDTIQVIDASHRPVPPLSPADERILREGLLLVDVERAEFAYGRQLLRFIHVLADGHVMIGLEDDPGRGVSTIDILTSHGDYEGSLLLPVPLDAQSQIASRGDTIVFVTRDALEVASVVHASIRKP